ncbi:magnetochrome domain-containing protein [Deltaproteobacteria bacterium TL4]
MSIRSKQRIRMVYVTIILISLVFALTAGLIVKHDLDVKELGIIWGRMPRPTEPRLVGSILERFTPKEQKTVIRRIPRISANMRMPHPYWGQCDRCHLFKDKTVIHSMTPVGKALGAFSETYKKVGPPILPDSSMPHPAAGRCIKCHDIVI